MFSVKLLNSSNDILDLIFVYFDHVSNYLLNCFLPTCISLTGLTLDHGEYAPIMVSF